MIRYVEGNVAGNLERRVVALLWLKTQVQDKTNERSYEYFASRFAIDIADIERNFTRLRTELLAYFRDQAKLVPEAAADIDQFLSDHDDNAELADLAHRRDDLLQRCDGLYYRVCLLASLLAYSAESSADDIGDLLGKLGFAVKVHANPIMDWDAVFRVVGSVFVLTIAINICFTAIANFFEQSAMTSRPTMMAFAVVTTLLYFVVVFVAMKFKRYRRRRLPVPANSENSVLAAICYIITLPISFAIRLWILHAGWGVAPFFFTANQGVVGYFIGTYVDRSVTGKPYSWETAATQAAVQAFVAALILYIVRPMAGMGLTAVQEDVFDAVFILQSAISGFMVGVIFQYYYRRTAPAQGEVIGDVTVETLQPAA
jgi:cation transporter-like permease